MLSNSYFKIFFLITKTKIHLNYPSNEIYQMFTFKSQKHERLKTQNCIKLIIENCTVRHTRHTLNLPLRRLSCCVVDLRFRTNYDAGTMSQTDI